MSQESEETGYKSRLRSNSKQESKMAGRGQNQSQNPKSETKISETSTPQVTPLKKPDGPITNEQILEAILGLQQSLQSNQREITEAKNSGTRLTTVENLQRTEANRINNLEDIVKDQDLKIRVLTNIVIRQEEQLDSISEVQKNERRAKIRRNIRISGLPEEKDEKPEKVKELLKDFFKEKLEISDEIKVKSAFRAGPKGRQDREIVAKLVDVADKGKVFKNTKNLKGKENAKRKLYFVNDDLDPEQAEQRMRYRQLLKENKEQETNLTIRYSKNRIVVNNEIIKPQIVPPKASDVLKLSDQERSEIKAVKMMDAGEHTENNSEYVAVVQKVRSVNEVMKGYYKMRIRYGDATHISCGYRLTEPLGPYRQEGFDDNEHGAG